MHEGGRVVVCVAAIAFVGVTGATGLLVPPPPGPAATAAVNCRDNSGRTGFAVTLGPSGGAPGTPRAKLATPNARRRQHKRG